MKNATIYTRVSTKDQHPENQAKQLKNLPWLEVLMYNSLPGKKNGRFIINFNIRPAKNEDFREITNLTHQLGYPSSEEKVKEILDMVLSHQDHQLFVAEIDNILVGYIHSVCPIRIGSDPFVEIAAFVVHSNYRKMGIGKSLIKETEKWALHKGYYNIRIRSNIIRHEAHKFFNQQGFNNLKTQEVFLKKIST